MFRISIIVFVLLLIPQTLFAGRNCACKRGTEGSIESSSAVFSGRVMKIIPISADEYIAQIAVYQGWKNADSEIINVFSSISDRDCGFDFITGSEYLIYAFTPNFVLNFNARSTNNQSVGLFDAMVVSSCGLSAALSQVQSNQITQLGKPKFSATLSTQKSYNDMLKEVLTPSDSAAVLP